MKEFEVYLEEAEEGGFVVTVPTLPGCVSEGETREEALRNIKDAIEGYLETLVRRKTRENETRFPNASGVRNT